MKVSELTGAALDFWVAKAVGANAKIQFRVCYIEKVCGDWMRYSPSTDWSQGGPIIEREEIQLVPRANGEQWAARVGLFVSGGDTALMAAMRCYVASRYGDEVSDDNV